MSRTVGIDLGLRTKHRAAVFDGADPRGKPFSVGVSREELDRLVERATVQWDGPVQFVMEPTGLAWVPVAAYVTGQGHKVSLAKPQKVSDLRKFYRKHTKSDAVDASTLGRLPAIDAEGLQPLALPSAQAMTLRRLVKRYERLTGEAADQKRRIHALMVMVNPFLMDALGEDKFGRATVAFMRRYADPEKVLKQGPSKLNKFWDKHSRGRASKERVQAVYEACRQAADLYRELRQRDQLPFDYAAVSEELNFELDRMERAESEAKQADTQVQTLYRKIDPERTLEQICGIGPVIAAALTALVGDITRFPNGSKFVSYCGLCPRKKQSGASDTPMPMTKTGQRLLKKYLYLAADVARQWDPDFAASYARRYARGDHHNRIMIALASKMAWRVYALLKRRSCAAQAAQTDPRSQPVRYVLRDANGSEIDRNQARELVKTTYARDLVAPQRRRKNNNSEGQRAAREWPPKLDATSCTEAPAALHNTIAPRPINPVVQQEEINR